MQLTNMSPPFGVGQWAAPLDDGKNGVDYYFMYMYSLYTLNFVNKKKVFLRDFYIMKCY